MSKTTEGYDCSKCSGRGHISGYNHVLGGVCFRCKGSGKQKSKPATPMQSWRVSAVLIASGERINICTIKAKTRLGALVRATAQLKRGNGYDHTTADVVPV